MGCIGFIVWRANAMFNVSKTKAAVITILCFIAGIPFMFNGITAMLTVMFWFYAFLYGCIWLFKYLRDKKVVAKVQIVHQAYTQQHNPDRNRLFVPPTRK